LRRLASLFEDGSSQLSTSTQSFAEATTLRNTPFGAGPAAPAANEAYAHTRDQLMALTNHIGSLMRGHADAVNSSTGTFEKVQASNSHRINASF
jgi:predicted translin family RNA/ssDNA-binding protein